MYYFQMYNIQRAVDNAMKLPRVFFKRWIKIHVAIVLKKMFFILDIWLNLILRPKKFKKSRLRTNGVICFICFSVIGKLFIKNQNPLRFQIMSQNNFQSSISCCKVNLPEIKFMWHWHGIWDKELFQPQWPFRQYFQNYLLVFLPKK